MADYEKLGITVDDATSKKLKQLTKGMFPEASYFVTAGTIMDNNGKVTAIRYGVKLKYARKAKLIGEVRTDQAISILLWSGGNAQVR